MSHFHIDYHTALNKMSYQNLILLSSSIPQTEDEEEEEEESPKNVFNILDGFFGQDGVNKELIDKKETNGITETNVEGLPDSDQ